MKSAGKGKHVKRFLATILVVVMLLDGSVLDALAEERISTIEGNDAQEWYSADAADSYIMDETSHISATDIASGTVNNGTTQGLTWVIDGAGKLTVTGTGDFRTNSTQMYPAWHDYADKIISAEINLKNITSTSYMFYDCRNMTSVDLSKLDTSNTITMNSMFDGCTKLKNLDLSKFDTSKVIWMQKMFCDCWNLTSLNLGSFKTSEVQNMSGMFDGSGVTSLNLSGFDTGKVTDMSGMFENCDKLTSLDLSSFDTKNVTDMSSMFYYCEKLSDVDVSFDVSKCTNMTDMFTYCKALKSIKTFKNLKLDVKLPVSTMYDESGKAYTAFPKNQTAGIWLKVSTSAGGEGGSTGDNIASGHYDNGTVKGVDWVIDANGNLTVTGTGNFQQKTPVGWLDPEWSKWRSSVKSATICLTGATSAYHMFERYSNLTSLDVSKFDTSQVTDMDRMFWGCSSLTSLDVSKFNTSQVTSMSYMFQGCSSLTSLDVTSFNTSQVTNMNSMFYGCSSLTSLDVTKFNTSQVTNMSCMFYGCSSLTSLDVTSFNTSQVTNMNSMFYDCSSLTSLDVSKFDTSNVTNMKWMFYGCGNLTSLDVSKFDTGKVTDMNDMFFGCTSLTSLDVSKFDTSNVTDMSGMFWGCSSLTSLDVSKFDTGKVTYISGMFWGCSSLTSLDLSNFNMNNVLRNTWGDGKAVAEKWFEDCTALTRIEAPTNVPAIYNDSPLPIVQNTSWYRTDTNETVTTLPVGLTKSVTLIRKGASTPATEKHTVTFDPLNGSGIVAKSVASGKTISLPKAPKMTGYNFAGWFTGKNGTGTQFTAKTKVTADITVYAKWIGNYYNIAFNKNGGTIVDKVALSKQAVAFTESFTLPGKSGETETKNIGINGSLIYRNGYILTGWNTKAKGNGTHYALGAKVSGLSNKNKKTVKLYAEWKLITYSITYDLGDNKRNLAVNNPLNPSTHTVAKAVKLKKPTLEGYTFVGWYLNQDYTQKVTSITKKMAQDVVLYAKWTENTYTIKFNGNGGVAANNNPDVLNKMSGILYSELVTLPSGSTLSKSGQTFAGWNTKKDGTGMSYRSGQRVGGLTSKKNGTVTLYAQWR